MYALSPIRFNLLFKPKFAVVKEVQSMNAPLPILVTLFGIEIFFNVLQRQNVSG